MKKTILSAVATTLLFAPVVNAYEKGDFVVRAGLTSVAPDESSDNVMVADLGGDTGMSVGVDRNTQLGLNFLYFVDDNWAVEVLAATPFNHEINLNNSALGLGDGKLAEASHLPPTVSVLHYFNDSQALFQPYVGVGINYTVFFDEEFTSARKEQGFNNLDLDSSFGFALQVGTDLKLTDNWHVNASARYIDIATTADFNVGTSAGSVEVDINPYVYTLSLGYKF